MYGIAKNNPVNTANELRMTSCPVRIQRSQLIGDPDVCTIAPAKPTKSTPVRRKSA